MDHEEAIRLNAAEQYLLKELSPEAQEEFEEHYFECHACAVDVNAGAGFAEQSKILFAEKPGPVPVLVPVPVPAPVLPKPWWLTWLRPAFVAPVLATLLALVAYQNLVTYPQLLEAVNHPQVLPWASVNISTYGQPGAGEPVALHAGQGFVLFVRVPPEDGYTRYTAELYDPAQKMEWTVSVPAASAHDRWTVQVPGAKRQSGTYTVVLRGEAQSGGNQEVGRGSFEVEVQK